MKLYSVTIERTLMVLADSEGEAENTALQNESDASYAGADFVHAYEVTDLKRVPKDWRESMPYGGEGELTCAQILEQQATI